MAYFRCTTGGSGKGNTLVVTCADDLAGATITCTNGTKTYTKACPSTSPYEVTFYGLEAGTWTVSTTVDGNTYTTTVVITDYEAELGGFNWKVWVDLSKNYTSSDFTDLDDLLSDETAIRELMTIHACVDYLAGIAAESADVETIIGNDLCAKWINLRDYALDTLYANTIIKGYMDTADKYFYGEWALMPQVPTMTSDSAPYGTAYTNAVYASKSAYLAFDGNDSTYAAFISAVNNYLQYSFVSPTRIKRVRVKIDGSNNNYKIQVSNDGFSSDIRDIATLENVSDYSDLIVDVESDYSDVSSARIIQTAKNGTASGIAIYSLQFYTWQPKGNVPVMTSNTAPYGTASATSEASGYGAYRAFDGDDSTDWRAASNVTSAYIGYAFPNPISVRRFKYLLTASGVTVTLEYSDDNSTYSPTSVSETSQVNTPSVVDVDEYGYHLYWRVKYTRSSAGQFPTNMLQFYGRELSVSVPKMDTNTTPYGEASADSETASGCEAYRAFSQISGDFWMSASTQEYNRYLEYAFVSPNVVKHIHLNIGTRSGATILTPLKFHFEAYDGSEWISITEVTTHNTNNDTAYDFDVEQSVNAQKIRYVVDQNLVNNNSRGNHLGCAVYSNTQFYGLDYSEKEFEEGTTKKWLYDHGLELETMIEFHSSDSAYTTKGENTITTKVDAVATRSASILCGVDLSDYSRLRTKIESVYSSYGNDANGPTLVVISTASPASTVDNDAITQVNTPVRAPYNISLDVSSFNTSKYVGIRSRNVSSNQFIKIMSVNELWLE